MVPDSDSALLPLQQNLGRYLQALPAAAQLGLLSTGGGLPSGSLVKKKKKMLSCLQKQLPRLFAFLVSLGWDCGGGEGTLLLLEAQPGVPSWAATCSHMDCGQPGWWQVPALGTAVTQVLLPLGWAGSPWVLQAPSPSTQTCSADSSSPTQRNTVEIWNHSPRSHFWCLGALLP